MPCRRAGARRSWLASLFAGVLLAGCQSSNVVEGLDPAAKPGAAEAPSVETVGGGATVIALLLPRSAEGAAGQAAADYRDGAALAVKDLGGGAITLKIYDTADGGPAARAKEAIADGAKLIVGPAEPRDVAAVAAAARGKRLPVLSLAAGGAAGPSDVFALASDEVDSAIEVAGYAAASGGGKILAVLPADFPARDRKRLEKGLGDALLGATHPAGLQSSKPLVAKAGAVLLFSGAAPADTAAMLRASGVLPADALLLGTSGWSAADRAGPGLDGALIAIPDPESLALVGERFEAAYGRPLTMEAAYAYDAVAIAAGLVRAKGAEALSPAAFGAASGFKGATGTFRFRKDGSVERLFAIYRLSRKGLVLQARAPDAF